MPDSARSAIKMLVDWKSSKTAPLRWLEVVSLPNRQNNGVGGSSAIRTHGFPTLFCCPEFQLRLTCCVAICNGDGLGCGLGDAEASESKDFGT